MTTRPSVADQVLTLALWCERHAAHITDENHIRVALESHNNAVVQLTSSDHAARTAVFALDALDDVRAAVARYQGDVQLIISGTFCDLPIRVVTIAHGVDADRVAALVDWPGQQAGGLANVTRLRALAKAEAVTG